MYTLVVDHEHNGEHISTHERPCHTDEELTQEIAQLRRMFTDRGFNFSKSGRGQWEAWIEYDENDAEAVTFMAVDEDGKAVNVSA